MQNYSSSTGRLHCLPDDCVFSVIDFIVVLSGGVLKNIVPCSLYNLCVKGKLKVDNVGY